MTGKKTFEIEFKIGDLDGLSTLKIFPEKDANGLYSTGRYVCEERLDCVHNMGEWEGECNETIHFTNKEVALSWLISNLFRELVNMDVPLETLENLRNKLNRQISPLKKILSKQSL